MNQYHMGQYHIEVFVPQVDSYLMYKHSDLIWESKEMFDAAVKIYPHLHWRRVDTEDGLSYGILESHEGDDDAAEKPSIRLKEIRSVSVKRSAPAACAACD